MAEQPTAPARPAVVSTLRRDILRIDRSAFSWPVALRNMLGVVLPLVLGAAIGQFGSGLTAAIGALNVAFSDRPGPYRLRLARMLVTTLAAVVSSLLGVLVSHAGWLDMLVLVIWGLAAGMLAALGPAAAQIGTASVILLLVLGGQSARLPFSPEHAVAVGLLVGAGGLVQTALSVAAWPLRRFGPERTALATLFGRLAVVARQPIAEASAPAATAEMSAASSTLAGVGSDRGTAAEALRSLATDAERIRSELLALSSARTRLADPAEQAASGLVAAALDSAADTLDAVAAVLRGARTSGPDGPLAAYDRALAAMTAAAEPAADPPGALVIATVRARALRGQLRAALELADNREQTDDAVPGVRPSRLRLRDPLAILRANVSADSAVFRHALRLAVTLLLGAAVAHTIGLTRGYWIGLTVAVVLKPDFGATFTRGLGRIGGTLLGLLVATGLAYVTQGLVADIVLIAVLVLLARLIGPANFALSGAAISGLVVLLTSLAGSPADQTILDRGVATLLGDALALVVYAVWPTWERGQVPSRLADVLHAYRRYTAVVLAGWTDPATNNPTTRDGPRRRSRLARSNAEASVDRLRNEPVRSAALVELAEGLLATSHRIVLAALALEAHLADTPTSAPPLAGEYPEALPLFAATVDRAYAVLGEAVGTRDRPRAMPDVRAAQRTLAEQWPDGVAGDLSVLVLLEETDRIAHGMDTLAHQLRRAHSAGTVTEQPTPAGPRPSPPDPV